MKLGELKPPVGSTKKRKRIGRGIGSGWGKSAGRGDKGSGQRSGHRRRPWYEGGQMPLLRRLPKRGFSNKLFKKDFQIVGLQSIENLDVEKVDAQLLYEKGLVSSAFKPIKILGDGNLTKAVSIVASSFSNSAIEKIKQAGGTATVL